MELEEGGRVVLSGKLRSHGWRRAAYMDVLVAIPGKDYPPAFHPRNSQATKHKSESQ